MPYGKRRKGKQGTRVPAETNAGGAEDDTNEESAVPAEAEAVADMPHVATAATAGNAYDLILTSEKRRGALECDYCNTDLSQLPRIR